MPTITGSSAPGLKILSFVRAASPSLAEQPADSGAARPVLLATKPKAAQQVPQASALAHDVRNALTALHLLSDLLCEPGVLQPDHAHFAGDLHTIADTLGGLFRNFEIAGIPVSPTLPVGDAPAKDVGKMLEGWAGLLGAVAGPQVAVHVSAESGLPPLRIGSEALSRVLVNLVKNASEAMPKSRTVRVTARRALSLSAPAVLIHVSDDGAGIPAYALGQIFAPGFTSKQSCGEACGLGLAIVRELVEASGGQVRVASTLRRGTTFEVRLPCRTSKR